MDRKQHHPLGNCTWTIQKKANCTWSIVEKVLLALPILLSPQFQDIKLQTKPSSKRVKKKQKLKCSDSTQACHCKRGHSLQYVDAGAIKDLSYVYAAAKHFHWKKKTKNKRIPRWKKILCSVLTFRSVFIFQGGLLSVIYAKS